MVDPGAWAATVPVAVGFGVATAEQVRQVGEIADGVIIGSRLVRADRRAELLDDGLRVRPVFLGEAAAALSPVWARIENHGQIRYA